ncbi:hypothetical protein, partial [Clostridium luticellarii]|uniref:hypothetical protein n=1 Tax=Clostridium luticellarii TaxID=1691940 RepID=UPI0023571BD3
TLVLLVLDVGVVKEHEEKVKVIATIAPNFNIDLITITPITFNSKIMFLLILFCLLPYYSYNSKNNTSNILTLNDPN